MTENTTENKNSGDALDTLAELRRRGEAAVLITVIAKEGHGPAAPGAKMVVTAGGRAAGTIGGGALEYIAIRKAREFLAVSASAPVYEVYDFGADEELALQKGAAPEIAQDTDARSRLTAFSPGAQSTGMACGGRASVFYECFGTGENFVLFGAGHIGRALARLLPGLGYKLTVIDCREEYVRSFAEASGAGGASSLRAVQHAYDTSFADLRLPPNSWIVIATHSHAFDYSVLEQCLRADVRARYIGVVASWKKRGNFFAQLKEAVPGADTSPVYMPAGLDIGGTGPEEIALSIMAEMQALRFGHAGQKHMRDRGAP